MSKTVLIKILIITGLVIGLFISGLMFYNVAMSPLYDVQDLEYNSNYEITVSDQHTVTIFINDLDVDSMYVDYYDNFHRLTYFIDDAEFNVLLIVKNGEERQEGFDIFVTHYEGGFDVENYHGIFTIQFNEPDTYDFALVTYDEFGTSLHMVSTNVEEARVKLITSSIIGVVTLTVSLIGLYKVSKNPKRDV